MNHVSFKRWLAGCVLMSLAMLSACGGDSDSSPSINDSETGSVSEPASRKVLLIGIEGVQYTQLQQVVGAGQASNLAAFPSLLPSHTGGILGTATQQQPIAGPGWATLLTGTWADQHEVRSDYPAQALGTQTVFERLKSQAPASKTAAVVSSVMLKQLLSAQQNTGALDLLLGCGGNDTCVTMQVKDQIAQGGYDLIVADYQSPSTVANARGLGADYRSALSHVDGQVGQLLAAIAQRQSHHAGEDWLVLVTASNGLGVTGQADGIPSASNMATFIAISQPANQALSLPAELPGDISEWYGYPAATDVTPTVLAFTGALPSVASYDLSGSPLTGPGAVRALTATPRSDEPGVNLSWTLPDPAPAGLTVWRDGLQIATLGAGATQYEDASMPLTESGTYTYHYAVAADQVAATVEATLVYQAPEPPVFLEDSLKTGLMHVFPLRSSLVDRMGGDSLFTPWVAGAQASYTAAGDGPFGNEDVGLKSTSYTGSTVCGACDGGFHISTALVTSNTSSFSFGFWFRSDGSRTGMPVVSNKNWSSGNNAGIAIGQYNNGDNGGYALRFNIGRGGARLGDKDLSFSPNSWVYVAMTVDVASMTARYYVYDPYFGLQSAQGVLTSQFLAALNGLGNGFSLNEDGDGGYGPNYRNGNASNTIAGRFDYGEFSSWSRALSEVEILSLGKSGTPLSTILP